MKIISPSYKRATNVKSRFVFPDLIIAVHESEAEEYRKANPDNEIMVLPDETRGNMAKVRNFIRDNCGDRYLIMVDDDVEEMGYHEEGEQYPLAPEQLMNMIQTGFEMAEDLKLPYWGINLQSDPKFYRAYTPISFTQPVCATFCAHIIGDDKKLRYDERLGLNEDYDYSIQVLRAYRKILRFNRYYYTAGHLNDAGGCGAYRLLDDEKEQALVMQKKWGNSIVKFNFDKSTNPIISVPIRGI